MNTDSICILTMTVFLFSEIGQDKAANYFYITRASTSSDQACAIVGASLLPVGLILFPVIFLRMT